MPGNYTNTAIVDPATDPEGDETNDMAQAGNVGLSDPDSSTWRSPRPTPAKVVPGGMVAYSLTVSNTRATTGVHVKVRDDLPAGTTFVSTSDTSGGAARRPWSLIGRQRFCTGGTLDGTDNLIPARRTSRRPGHPGQGAGARPNIDALAPDRGQRQRRDRETRAFIDSDNAIPEIE